MKKRYFLLLTLLLVLVLVITLVACNNSGESNGDTSGTPPLNPDDSGEIVEDIYTYDDIDTIVKLNHKEKKGEIYVPSSSAPFILSLINLPYYATYYMEKELINKLAFYDYTYDKCFVELITATGPEVYEISILPRYEDSPLHIHQPSEYYMDIVPSSTEPGLISFVCNKCFNTVEISLPKLGGSFYNLEFIDSTCLTSGKSRYSFIHRGIEYEINVSNDNIKNHEYDSYEIVEYPTLSVEGVIKYRCKNCEQTFVETLPSLDNSEYIVNEIKKPTCTEDGINKYTLNRYNLCITIELAIEKLPHEVTWEYDEEGHFSKCINCDYVSKKEPHIYGDWILDKYPTLLEDGLKHKDCICGHTITEVIPKLQGQGVIDNANTEYTKATDGEYYYVTKYNGTEEHLIIPDTYNGLPVQQIGQNAFSSNSHLKDVYIANSITNIGVNAFSDCSNLTEVKFDIQNSNLNIISDFAFAYCTSLVKCDFPNNLTKIMNQAFNYCLKLKDIVFDMENCSLSYIGSYAFDNCNSLVNIYLPKSLVTIDYYAFADCDNILNIIIEANNLVEMSCFVNHSNNYNVYVLNNKIYEQIQNNRYDGKFSSNYIGYDDTNDYDYCQYVIYNINASDFFIYNNSKYIVNELGIFYAGPLDITKTSYVVPGKVKYNGKVQNVVGIAQSSFANIQQLEEVTIEEGIQYINDGAFMNCRGLTNVHLPNSLKAIETQAFCYCDSLEVVDVPVRVETIGKEAFSFSGLRRISIPSVANIYDDAFIAKNLEQINSKDTMDPFSITTKDGCVIKTYDSEGSIQLIAIIGDNFKLPNNIKYFNDIGLLFKNVNEVIIPKSVVHYNASHMIYYFKTTVIKFESSKDAVDIINGYYESNFIFDCNNNNSNSEGGVLYHDNDNNLYSIKDNKAKLISFNFSTIEHYIMPDTILYNGQEIPLVDFDLNAFHHNDSIKSVTLNKNLEDYSQEHIDEIGISNIFIPKERAGVLVDYIIGYNHYYTDATNNEDITINHTYYNVTAIFTKNGVTYVLKNDELYLYNSCTSLAESLDLSKPVEYKGQQYELVHIDYWYFERCNVKNLILPKNLKDPYCLNFESNVNLRSVVLPENTLHIRENTFKNCINLETITLPKYLLEIEKSAFENCNKLVNIILPNYIGSIEANAFNGTAIKEIVLPASVVFIGTNVFGTEPIIVHAEHNNLNISKPVDWDSSFMSNTIDYCYNNLEITLDNNDVYNYVVHDGEVFITGIRNACDILEIKDTINNMPVKGIGNTMQNCTFYHVVLPETIEYIPAYAFARAPELRTVKYSKNIKAIGKGAFIGSYGIPSFYIGNSCKYIGERAFEPAVLFIEQKERGEYWQYNIINDSNTMLIGTYYYFNCLENNISKDGCCVYVKQGGVVFQLQLTGNSADIIDIDSFITELYVPKSINYDGKEYFPDRFSFRACYKLSKLNKIEILSPAYPLDDYLHLGVLFTGAPIITATFNTENLSNLDLPFVENLTLLLGYNTHQYSKFNNVKTLTVNKGETVDRAELRDLTLPALETLIINVPLDMGYSLENSDKVEGIYFKDATVLSNTQIYTGLKNNAKIYIDNIFIENFEMPTNIEVYDSNVFINYKYLKTIVVPSNVLQIGGRAFYNCINLESLTLNEGLQTISYGAFSNCKKLKIVNIPSSVQAIGYRAFEYCYKTVFVKDANRVYSIGVSYNESDEVDKFGIIIDKGKDFYVYEGLRYSFDELNNKIYLMDQDETLSGIINIPAQVPSPVSGDMYPLTIEGYGQFARCNSITGFTSTHPSFRAENGCILDTSNYLVYISNNATIPSSAIGIRPYVFTQNYPNDLVIPATIQFIEPHAFEQPLFTSLTFETGSQLKKLSSFAIDGLNVNTLVLPDTEITYEKICIKNSIIDNLIYPCLGTTTFESSALRYNTVNNIKMTSFDQFFKVNQPEKDPIYINHFVPGVIAKNVYINGELLTSLNWPSDKTIIPYVFSHISSLTNVYIPSTVKEIEASFTTCDQINTVEIDSLESWFNIHFINGSPANKGACLKFKNGNVINELNIPNTIEVIPSYSLNGLTFDAIHFPYSVYEIGSQNYLTVNELYIPATVVYMSNLGYGNHNKINKILMDVRDETVYNLYTEYSDTIHVYGVNNITSGDFSYVLHDNEAYLTACHKSGDIVVPNYIDGYKIVSLGTAFHKVKDIENINIQNKFIKDLTNSFNEAYNIKTIKVPGNVKVIREKAIFGCNNPNIIVYLSDGIETLEKEAINDVTMICPLSLVNFKKDFYYELFSANTIDYVYSLHTTFDTLNVEDEFDKCYIALYSENAPQRPEGDVTKYWKYAQDGVTPELWP